MTRDERLELIRYYFVLAHDNHPDGHVDLAATLAHRLDSEEPLTEDERRDLL